MSEHIDAGQMNERPFVLCLVRTETGYEWKKVRRTWAKAEPSTRRNNFSTHGIGAAGVSFIMRSQCLGLSDALLWQGHHCFITSVSLWGRNNIKVEAALTTVHDCLYAYDGGVKFPAIMTEEYHRHEQLEPHAVNALRHVLVTPKCIDMAPGRLVEVDGEKWPILTTHTLDPYKNEYIIERTVDL